MIECTDQLSECYLQEKEKKFTLSLDKLKFRDMEAAKSRKPLFALVNSETK